MCRHLGTCELGERIASFGFMACSLHLSVSSSFSALNRDNCLLLDFPY